MLCDNCKYLKTIEHCNYANFKTENYCTANEDIKLISIFNGSKLVYTSSILTECNQKEES